MVSSGQSHNTVISTVTTIGNYYAKCGINIDFKSKLVLEIIIISFVGL